MNTGALHDTLSGVILPYLLLTHTNPTILTFRTVSKLHLLCLTNYVYSVYTSTEPEKLISCDLVSLLLPQHDDMILELIKQDRMNVTQKDTIFPSRQCYKDKEHVYYSAVLSFSLDYSVPFEDKLLLIEREICTLDELFDRKKDVYQFVGAFFSDADNMSETTIDRLRHHMELLIRELGLLRKTQLMVRIVRQLDIVELLFDHMQWAVYSLSLSLLPTLRHIHSLVLICIEFDQTRTLSLLELDVLNSSVSPEDDDINRVWFSNGESYYICIDNIAKHNNGCVFKQHVIHLRFIKHD